MLVLLALRSAFFQMTTGEERELSYESGHICARFNLSLFLWEVCGGDAGCRVCRLELVTKKGLRDETMECDG